MDEEPRISHARALARKSLRDRGVKEPSTPIFEIVTASGLALLRRHWGRDIHFDALLFHVERVIAVNEDRPARRQRFSVAHELGHYLLEHHYLKRELVSVDIDHPPDTDHPVSGSVFEQEANAFASEVLMPREFLLRYRQPRKEASAEVENGSSFRPFADLARQLVPPHRQLTSEQLADIFDVSEQAMVIALKNHHLL